MRSAILGIYRSGAVLERPAATGAFLEADLHLHMVEEGSRQKDQIVDFVLEPRERLSANRALRPFCLQRPSVLSHHHLEHTVAKVHLGVRRLHDGKLGRIRKIIR